MWLLLHEHDEECRLPNLVCASSDLSMASSLWDCLRFKTIHDNQLPRGIFVHFLEIFYWYLVLQQQMIVPLLPDFVPFWNEWAMQVMCAQMDREVSVHCRSSDWNVQHWTMQWKFASLLAVHIECSFWLPCMESPWSTFLHTWFLHLHHSLNAQLHEWHFQLHQLLQARHPTNYGRTDLTDTAQCLNMEQPTLVWNSPDAPFTMFNSSLTLKGVLVPIWGTHN